ncbi:MAG: AtpZ/AtpI family protein [Candidatus Kerfeldbacteria bacterium]|nr:AtpZ/AtpI family protein [Candidatus Kerfeldbacteria bacterium]
MEKPIEKAWWQPALAVFGEVTGWIVAPILLALFGGRWLDERFQTDPWFYLGLTALAVTITVVGLVKIGGKYIRQVENMKTTKKPDERNNRTT